MKRGHEKFLVELIQNCFVLLFSLFRINEERTYILLTSSNNQIYEFRIPNIYN